MLSARGFSFRTDSWARTIVDFYRATPGAGVIGFFGYALKTRSPSLMGGLSRYERASLYQHIGERVVRLESRAGEADFSPVVQVDGQCLIVPKAVWREHPFDEELFRDFHLYDVGMNLTAPKILQERLGIGIEQAAYATSIYFLFRTIGSFAGAFLLARFAARPFFLGSVRQVSCTSMPG